MTTLEIALAGFLVFGQPVVGRHPDIVKYAGLQAIHSDGAVSLRLAETGREETQGEDGSRTIAIRLKDEKYPFEVVRHVKSWSDCDVVETWLDIRHGEKGPVKLLRADSFASRVDCGNERTVKVLSLTGRWAHEANISESTVASGSILELSSKAGTRNAWESNAAMMVLFGDNVGEETGKVLGVALEWTGTACRRIRRDCDGRTEVFAGVDMTTGPYTLDPGVTFTTPKAHLVWSEKGKGEVSREYHRWARRHLMPHGDDLRPVLLNSWEGSYFSFTEKTLTDMMDGVKAMGGEMFVVDDGWFGKGKYARDSKNRDKTGLGDWCVNTEKLPRGLGYIADEAKKRGLQFGLWVEPEMVNTASWLAEAHPDWLLCEEGRKPVLARGGTQLVLDFANPAVRDDIFNQLDAVYASIPSLAYIKWDCNCALSNPGSKYLPADRQPNLWYDYTKGLYDLAERFGKKRPHIMVEACAGGGGHMDFGFLRHADEFWPSDNTDPLARVFIQWGALQFYPASAMACHVTVSGTPNTKKKCPMKYRFDVSMMGALGFELHPKRLKKKDMEFCRKAVEEYKRIRPIVQRGDLYRLVSPYEKPLASLMYASEDKRAAVLFAIGVKIKGKHVETLKLRGLDPDAMYAVKEINRGKRLHATLPEAKASGKDLMEKGIDVTLSGEYDSATFEIRICDKAI